MQYTKMHDVDLNNFVQIYCKDKAFKKLIFNKYDKNDLSIFVNDCGKIEWSTLTEKQDEKVQKLLDKYYKDWSVKYAS